MYILPKKKKKSNAWHVLNFNHSRYYLKSNARVTIYFTTRSLQTDVTSYIEATTSAIKTQLNINI